MVKVKIDRARCVGHARCAAAAPELFLLDDVGYIASQGFEAADADEAAARRGARACPERVITIQRQSPEAEAER